MFFLFVVVLFLFFYKPRPHLSHRDVTEPTTFTECSFAGFESALERTEGRLLIVVVFILVIVAAVHLGGGVGDDTVGRGVGQAGPLLRHQQGGGVLNAAAFLHIVHLRRTGRDRGSTLSKHKQTSTEQSTARRTCPPVHFLLRGIFQPSRSPPETKG